MTKKWQSYEELAAYLLNRFAKEFGLKRVEGKQKVPGRRSGTDWEIDAKGVRENNEGFVIVECRRYTTLKQNQEKLGSLAYRMIDTGANGGIMVSPLGIQEGAAKIAASENICNVQLDADSTPQKFAMQFLNKIMAGVSETIRLSDSLSCELICTCKQCGERFTVKGNGALCPVCAEQIRSEGSA